MSVVPVAVGPAMYFGSSIMSFALPYAAFIVIALVLFYLYRRPHHGPRLKYLVSGPITAVLTREPGPIPAPSASGSAGAEPAAPASDSASAQAPAEDKSGEGTPEGEE